MIVLLERHLIWSSPDGTTHYYYYDEITWVVAIVAVVWLTWILVSRYRRAQALRRRPRRADYRQLKRVIKAKDELSARFLQPGVSRTIHAVGIGRLTASNDYCIQIFISDPNEELWVGAGAATLPNSYLGIPLTVYIMPVAGFMSDAGLPYPNGIREHQEVIVGGISGANSNLTGESGTIGYFCTRKSKLPRPNQLYLLSNTHVLADVGKPGIDDSDLIMQPSPGERTGNRPIGALVNFSPIVFDGNLETPNRIDAAIAKLWGTQQHKLVIPLIGTVDGFVEKKDIQLGEAVCKFGRTTGYTEGCIFSIYLDIWIRYDRTGQSAFFKDQLLIEPSQPAFPKFVRPGDSGSLVSDQHQHAIGLIFGGTSEVPAGTAANSPGHNLQTIQGCGVANPISEVLEKLKIELARE
ncbi:MAG TPA: hypothetical protein VF290_28620 [Pyrinomonadaceae bacterium]